MGCRANFVDLAKVGPFTVRGYCALSQGVEAYTDVLSAQNGSSLAWDDSNAVANFNSGDVRQASNAAHGSTQTPDFEAEYDNGEFTVSTGDQKTAFTGWATNGVYIQGPMGRHARSSATSWWRTPAPDDRHIAGAALIAAPAM